MAHKWMDLNGKVFSSWTVLRLYKRTPIVTHWLCRCVCGKERPVSTSPLVRGNSKSCGCVVIQKIKAKWKAIEKPFRKEIRNIYGTMRQRCLSKTHLSFINYGGRGIKISKKWDDFWVFYDWCIKNGYKKGLQIDRINNDNDYSPENCRFVTPSQNSYNRRNTRIIEYEGKKYNRLELSKLLGISYSAVRFKFK